VANIQEIRLREPISLLDDYSSPERITLPAGQKVIEYVSKDFFISDLCAEGRIEADVYTKSIYAGFGEAPTRFFNKALSPAETFALQTKNDQQPCFLNLSVSLLIPGEELRFLQLHSKSMPLVCLVASKADQYNLLFADFVEGGGLNSQHKIMPRLSASTWRLLEDSPERLAKRWAEFWGAYSSLDPRIFSNTGEVLLLSNQEEELSQIYLKFLPFG